MCVSLFSSVECEVNGVTYKNGAPFYIPQNPVQYNDISCRSCSCDRGAQSCRGNFQCDFFFPCDKFIPASQGECCPTCGKPTSKNSTLKWNHFLSLVCLNFLCIRFKFLLLKTVTPLFKLFYERNHHIFGVRGSIFFFCNLICFACTLNLLSWTQLRASLSFSVGGTIMLFRGEGAVFSARMFSSLQDLSLR